MLTCFGKVSVKLPWGRRLCSVRNFSVKVSRGGRKRNGNHGVTGKQPQRGSYCELLRYHFTLIVSDLWWPPSPSLSSPLLILKSIQRRETVRRTSGRLTFGSVCVLEWGEEPLKKTFQSKCTVTETSRLKCVIVTEVCSCLGGEPVKDDFCFDFVHWNWKHEKT